MDGWRQDLYFVALQAMEKEIVLRVEGMTCGHCRNFVAELVKDIDGVLSEEVSLEEAQAKITFDANKTSEEEIKEAINKSQTYQAK